MIGKRVTGSPRDAGQGVSRPGTSSGGDRFYYLKDREGVIPFERHQVLGATAGVSQTNRLPFQSSSW